MGSYTWKSHWRHQYHPSMATSLGSLVIGSLLSLGKLLVTRLSDINIKVLQSFVILVNRNKKLDADENAAMQGANRSRVEEAARLEGLTFEQAMERRKGFRYLY